MDEKLVSALDENVVDKIQFELLKILRSFVETCNVNNINYILAYGTLLGAIRHSGFIPWDDDIDIFMTRAEYKKLKQVFKVDNLEILDCDEDKKYPYLFPKIRKKDSILIEKSISNLNYNTGLYVDIFILDEVPSGKIKEFFKKKRLLYNYKKYRLVTLNNSSINKIIRPLAFIAKKVFNLNKLIKKINRIYSTEKNSTKYRDVSMPSSNFYLDKSFLNTTTEKEFCNLYCKVPLEFDELLKRFYGEYMQLPKPEDRISNHSFHKFEL